MTFHAALADPTVRPDSPERQSIEERCRAFLLFPDFEPDARPALPFDTVAESVDPVESDAEVEAAVQRSFLLIYAMSSWPGASKTWLMTTSAKLDGVRETAQTLVHDADADLVVLSVCAVATFSADEESVTMCQDELYLVSATLTAESGADFATALSAVVLADDGDVHSGSTNATSILPSWIGVNDDLLAGCSATRQVTNVFDTWTCLATLTGDSCAAECAAGYECPASEGVVFNSTFL